VRKSCEVTADVLRFGAALALFACTSPTYSAGKDAAGSAASGTSPSAGDGPAGTGAPGRDAGSPLLSDASGKDAPRQDGGGGRDAAIEGAAPASPDAGTGVTTVASEPLPDAGVVMSSSTLPSWAPKLLGKYAVVIYSFSDDGLVRTSSRDVGTMDITAGAHGYEALLSGCQSYGSSTGGTSSAQVVYPTALPARRFQVILGADTFVAKPIDVAVGYEQAQPPGCDGHLGEQVDKRDFQTWISGSKCRCSDQAPPQVDDCRVVDADGDKRPGYTVNFRTPIASTDVYGAIESRSSIVQGHVADSGAHTAFFQLNDVVAQFGCDPPGCADVGGVAMSCDTINSQVLFASLDRSVAPASGWTCASIIDRFTTLFPLSPPAFPARCKAR